MAVCAVCFRHCEIGEGRLGFEYMAFVEASDYLVLGDQLGVDQHNGKFVVVTTLDGGSPK